MTCGASTCSRCQLRSRPRQRLFGTRATRCALPDVAALSWAARRAARCAVWQRQQARHSTWACSKSVRRAPRRRSTNRLVRRGTRALPGCLYTCLLGWLLARRTASTDPLPLVRALCRSCRPRRRHQPSTSVALGWATATAKLCVPHPLACSSSPAVPSPSTCSPPSGSSHGAGDRSPTHSSSSPQ